MTRIGKAAAAGVAAVALVVPVAAPASADTSSVPVAGGFVGPLGLDVGSDGTIYVAEAFGGSLSTVSKKGERSVLVSGRSEIAGVDARGKGRTVFVATESPEDATLERVLPNGRTRVLAQLGRYEAEVNPDQGNEYGFVGLSEQCAAAVPEALGGGVPYSGIVESHPYAVAAVGGGWVVADAAGNDLLQVAANGRISTLAVLPPQPNVIDADLIASFNEALAMETPQGEEPPVVPDCVAGATFLGEAVPTDVELGPDGYLYVSTLPGFPELPGTASVYRVDPRSGEYALVGTGFSGATDLAVAPDGTVYVAELFGGQVSRLTAAGPVTVAQLPFPTAVEFAQGRLFVAQVPGFGEGNPIGQVVTITP